ncbi:relaxase/mobilization nuclease domain-containing protein [Nocardia asteroides]|uniref:relaxase/mobilization nuclease domain-containing protein n=1 Tax=Nocardia asteroides TaxID=1824 RepID=UPI0037A259A3
MIPKIGRGQKIGGLMVYLLGEGDHNEHKDRHIIAGSPTVMREVWLDHFDGAEAKRPSRDTALAVAHEIDIPRRLYGTQVRMKAKAAAGARGKGVDVIERPDKGSTGVMRDAPVWHCVLSLSPGESLTDEQWSTITHDFMTEMGFTASADAKRAQARWAAVRHGLSGEHGDGQDHIHIAASLVRDDGSKVSTYDYGPGNAKGDWKRAQEVCNLLEHRHGLKVLASREQGGALSGDSRAEYERTQSGRTPESERDRLRRLVRTAAVGAENETEFVTALRESGVSVAPRWAAGGQNEVTGYKVRLHRDGAEAGPWLGGGTLAKDLTLTALREQQWTDTEQGRADARAVWKNKATAPNGPGQAKARSRGPQSQAELWQQAAVEFGDWQQHLAEIPREDRARWAWVAGQAAGAFSAWSEQLEGETPGALAAAAKELTRSAQAQSGRRRYRPTAKDRPIGDLTKLLLSTKPFDAGTRLPGRPDRQQNADDAVATVAVALLALLLILLLAAIAALLEVARAHRHRGELSRALAVEGVTGQHLLPVRERWEQSLEQRRYQWDRDAAQVFSAIAIRAAERRGEPQTAAAQGPLTPPPAEAPKRTAKPKPREPFYSELTAEQKAAVRTMAVANVAIGARDLKPRTLDDATLEGKLTHLRAEVELLARDLDARRVEGPHTRKAKDDIAAARSKSVLIEAARKADEQAEKLRREKERQDWSLQKLQKDLDATPRRKFLARQQLEKDIAASRHTIAELSPRASAASAAASAAAEATGSPREEWHGIEATADPRRQQLLLAQAQQNDKREFDADTGYLQRHLRTNLDKLESEHARRSELTPQQRAAEQSRRVQERKNPAKPRSPKSPSTGHDPYRGHPPPDLGPARSDGPEL